MLEDGILRHWQGIPERIINMCSKHADVVLAIVLHGSLLWMQFLLNGCMCWLPITQLQRSCSVSWLRVVKPVTRPWCQLALSADAGVFFGANEQSECAVARCSTYQLTEVWAQTFVDQGYHLTSLDVCVASGCVHPAQVVPDKPRMTTWCCCLKTRPCTHASDPQALIC
jgi:hypothetical protein